MQRTKKIITTLCILKIYDDTDYQRICLGKCAQLQRQIIVSFYNKQMQKGKKSICHSYESMNMARTISWLKLDSERLTGIFASHARHQMTQ